MKHSVTVTPAAVPNLVDGESYYLQNQSVYTIVAEQLTAAPADASADGRTFKSGEGDHFEVQTGKTLYVWLRPSEEGHTGSVYISPGGWGVTA